MAFKYIELFAGIGGFRSALDPLGGECVFASEIDPFATRARLIRSRRERIRRCMTARRNCTEIL
ncbi:DNA cytosine methyltransferase [Paenibacillus sp. SI8]|uniref:DNA cytosine methyltransferase n=1 Tax=unclassified Paenibacillus TaxID=185978 RepID=UPI0034663393